MYGEVHHGRLVMTVKGHTNSPVSIRQEVARLVQIHYDTHPIRIALKFGFTPGYVRSLWRQIETERMAPNHPTIDNFRRCSCHSSEDHHGKVQSIAQQVP